MKYELNKPYDFEVKNVINNDGTLRFEVDIDGNLFPVKAFPEQIEDRIPTNVSCRIVRDKNGNAYLIQNEAFLFPFIYHPFRKYIFEVVSIKDSFVVLQDKYGLLHTMPSDGLSVSLNEIIVRYVEIINENNFRAHLNFLLDKPQIEEKKDDIYPDVEASSQPQYAPTVFVQEQPTSNTTSPNNDQAPASDENRTVSSMLLSKEWDYLETYFDDNLKGRQIPQIQQEVASAIEQYDSAASYWETIRFILNYDAHLFLGTLAKIDTPKIKEKAASIDTETQEHIIDKAFSATDKLRFALDLITPLRENLTVKQKNYIQMRCAEINDCETFYSLFKLLKFSPDEAVVYLLSLSENLAAAYTLYKFYYDGKRAKRLFENSVFEAFRPSGISEYCNLMETFDSFAFNTAALLIRYKILNKGTCPQDILKAVQENGYQGFRSYVVSKESQNKAKELITSLSIGDSLYGLKFMRELDNHFLLFDSKTNSYVLLLKNLTEKRPTKEEKCQARIAQILKNRGKTFYIVSQKTVPPTYIFPPLVNQSTILEIAFTENYNGNWYPEVKHYCKFLHVIINSRPRFVDYKIRHKIKIIGKKDFFSYYVDMIV